MGRYTKILALIITAFLTFVAFNVNAQDEEEDPNSYVFWKNHKFFRWEISWCFC